MIGLIESPFSVALSTRSRVRGAPYGPRRLPDSGRVGVGGGSRGVLIPMTRIENPVQGDAVTFLERSARRTFGLLEVAPGGKVTPLYHRSYTERFKVISGRLDVMLDGERRTLAPGEEA